MKISIICLMLLLTGCGAIPIESPSKFEGIFHFPGTVDADNLEIRNDGTFAFFTFGCDTGGSDRGTWRSTGRYLILEPQKKSGLFWPGKGGFLFVKQIELSALGSDSLQAKVVPLKESDKTMIESPKILKRGKICAQCGGSLGPTGPAKLCSEIQGGSKTSR
jgi:hypothetical protein